MTIWEKNETQSRISLVIAMLFFLAICLPLLGMLGQNNDELFEAYELRKRAEMPTFELARIDTYPTAFTSYFNDAFGFRHQLISLNGRIRYTLFDVSGASKVLVGKNGWLFYTGDKLVEEYRGLTPFSPQDLEKWRTVLEAKQQWLAAQGIAYLFVVPPNKHTIYPEYYPDRLQKVSDVSPLEQIVSYLKHNSSVQIVDLREPLLSQKSRGLLYYPVGTHWTSFGSFLGYREMMARISQIFPHVTPLSFDDITPSGSPYPDDGLAGMLGVRDMLKKDIEVFVPKAPKAVPVSTERGELVTEVVNADLPRAVMFRDSFTELWAPFLSENFSYIRYLSTRWYADTPIEEIIAESKPDIVIEELVERSIKYMEYVSIAPQN